MSQEPRLPPSAPLPLADKEELVVARGVDDDADSDAEFSLLPPDCPSREQFSRGHEPIALPPPEPPPPARVQFSMADLMIVTVGIGLGLAGGTWMPAELFAAVLGLMTLVGLLGVHLSPPESHLARLIWGTWVLAYFIAVAAAVARSWFPVA